MSGLIPRLFVARQEVAPEFRMGFLGVRGISEGVEPLVDGLADTGAGIWAWARRVNY